MNKRTKKTLTATPASDISHNCWGFLADSEWEDWNELEEKDCNTCIEETCKNCPLIDDVDFEDKALKELSRL